MRLGHTAGSELLPTAHVMAEAPAWAQAMEKNIIGNLVGTWAELTELMELAHRGLVDLTTQEYALSDANLALRDLHDGKIRGRAVLIP